VGPPPPSDERGSEDEAPPLVETAAATIPSAVGGAAAGAAAVDATAEDTMFAVATLDSPSTDPRVDVPKRPASDTRLLAPDGDEAVDVEGAVGAEELLLHSAAALKAELGRRGLKVGGTAGERAARLWAVRGLSAADVHSRHRPKPRGAAAPVRVQAELAAAAPTRALRCAEQREQFLGSIAAPGAAPPAAGRGRGSVLPAWMTAEQREEAGQAAPPPAATVWHAAADAPEDQPPPAAEAALVEGVRPLPP
jgi:hypothetical protein